MLFLVITIMFTMSVYSGYKKEIIKYLELEKGRVPSFSTVRGALMKINHKKFRDIFTKRLKFYMKKNNFQWIAVSNKIFLV